MQNNFDVSWATNEGMGPSDDIDGFNRTWTPAWSGSNRTYFNTTLYQIGIDNRTDINITRIPNETWNLCNGTYQNMWVTFTRI